jgi:hypothetical protein
VAVRDTSLYDGRVKNVTEEARERLRFLQVFQKQKIPAQKGMIVDSG